jgi:hypothetical protein
MSKNKQPLNPWMTKALFVSKKKKDHLAKVKTGKPTIENILKYKVYNSTYRKIIRTAKKTYYETKLTEYANDIKNSWKIIYTLISNKKSKHDIPGIFSDGSVYYTGAKEIAEGFNDYFVKVGPTLAEAIPESNISYEHYMPPPTPQNFVFANVTQDLILETLAKLKPKNSLGGDNISTKLLKYIISPIAPTLTHLFNLSFKTGYIPDNYKCARVIPIYKDGDRDKFNNYRPISILPAFSKLLEKIATRQMFKYLNKYNIFYDHQYGFRPRHSTNYPILQFLDKIHTALNKPMSEFTLSIFLDLKKAFDTCDHSILLSKLNNYGFRGISNEWFRNYLINRTQFVTLEEESSSMRTIKCGVPQGSVIGPLLFLLYINDLPRSNNFFTSLFADDTGFLKSSPSLNTLFNEANEELEKASSWFQSNKLSLNVSKTKYIVFRNNKMPLDENICKLRIGNEELVRIGNNCQNKYYKFVGIRFDEFLNWEHQTIHVANKIASATFAINQTKNILPQNTRILIYNSLVRSHLDYGNISWGLKYNKNITRITKLQKKAVRAVGKKGAHSHCDPLFAHLEILKFNDLVNLNVCNFMYKFNNSMHPVSFKYMFEPLSLNNRTICYKLKKNKSTSLDWFPSFTFPKIWNSIPREVKCAKSLNIFKKILQNKFLSKYKSFRCSNRSCYGCKQ